MPQFLIVSGHDILARTEKYPEQSLIDSIRDSVFGPNSNIGLNILKINPDYSTSIAESFC